jgi:hypothetical protein
VKRRDAKACRTRTIRRRNSDDLREEHNKVADYRSELQRQALEFRRAGKADEAEKFVKEANKALAQYGTSIR